MKSYTVHERPKPLADRIDRAADLVFIKDGFNFLAFIAAPVWMIVNRLWMVLFIYLVIMAALLLATDALGIAPGIRSALTLGLSALVGFEADSLRRWTLARRGWSLVGSVTGESLDVCQRRFFESWLPTVPAVATENFAGFESDPLGGKPGARPQMREPVVAQQKGRGFGRWRTAEGKS